MSYTTYRKVVGILGDVAVFRGTREPSCHYCVTAQPDTQGFTWANVWHHGGQWGGHSTDSVEIEEQEYLAHLKFALGILDAQVNGEPLKPRVCPVGYYFDALNFTEENAKQQAG